MSKSTSPRAAKRDWAAMLKDARAADRPANDEELDLWKRGLIDGTANWHGEEYIHALQRSLEGREHADLLSMLDQGLPIPPPLLPLLADVLRALVQGSVTGKPARLTAHEDRFIREWFDLHVVHFKKARGEMQLYFAERFGVSPDTIVRSLRRTENK